MRRYFLVCKCQERVKRFQWKSTLAVRDDLLKVMQEKVNVTHIVFYIEIMNLGSGRLKNIKLGKLCLIFSKGPSTLSSYFRYRTQRMT